MKNLFVLILLLLFVVALWKNFHPGCVGVINGHLHLCPWTPNCVSSESTDPKHAIAPLPYHSENTLDQIEACLAAHYQIRVIEKTPVYLYVVATTKLLRFKDDLEFLVYPDQKVVHVRSASRVGYGDMNVNRQRIEQVRNCLEHR